MLNKQVTLILALLAVSPLMSAQNERIRIEKSTRCGQYPLGDRACLDAKIDGKPFGLVRERAEERSPKPFPVGV